jgi:hypothetical protein
VGREQSETGMNGASPSLKWKPFGHFTTPSQEDDGGNEPEGTSSKPLTVLLLLKSPSLIFFKIPLGLLPSGISPNSRHHALKVL